MNRPIIVFDSGIGGLPYLVHIRSKYPCENFVYIADSKNFPYGDKPEDELIDKITNAVVTSVKRFNPKAVVLACNTASVTSLKQLRAILHIPVVGVVPAIKTASQVTKNNKIGILATNRTVSGSYLKNLITEFSVGKEVLSVGASGIVNFVENELHKSSKDAIKEFIDIQVLPLKDEGVDSVVLGCTHFIHVEDEIKESLGEKVKVIDSREGVTNQLSRVTSLNENNGKRGYSHFYLTKLLSNSSSYKMLCNNSELKYIGEL